MIKNVIKMLVGFFMLACVVAGYSPSPEYIYEMTCISNTAGGILLILDAMHGFHGKGKISDVLFMNVSLSILTVFFICAGSLLGLYGNFNFNGPFFFLHAVTPLAFVLCYLFFHSNGKGSLVEVLTAPIMMLCYLLFDYIRSRFTGEFIYGLVDTKVMSVPLAIVTGIVIYAVLVLLAFGLNALRGVIKKKSDAAKPSANVSAD